MIVRFRLGNITETRPVHGQLITMLPQGGNETDLSKFTVKIFQVLRLSTKFLAVLRLSVNPIETLLVKLPQQFRREPIVSSADFFPPSKLCDSYHPALLFFFNRSLEEGKIGIMKLGKARSTTTVYL